jgi:hypothetical protein
MSHIFLVETAHTLNEAITLFSTPKAYLDPGSGSFVLQLVIAALLGGLFVIKGYWMKIKNYVKGMIYKKDEKDEEHL